METPEAIELLEQQKNLICHDCTHPAMVGWCENHCKLSEAFDMAINTMNEKTKRIRPRATVSLDYGCDGRNERWYIAYSCPTCGITIYPKEAACGRCGTIFDWSKSAEIKVSREVVWK